MISKKHSSKAAKKAGSMFNAKRNYSDFWMDSKWDSRSMFSGISQSIPQTSDIVKAIKLANYRRAVTNFVKILTKQEIPVVFAGSDSYTDGKRIVLSTDIKENNFDVTVGLALHEASHIILTDFEILPALQRGDITRVEETISKLQPHQLQRMRYTMRHYIQNILNWVEDRRIDHFVFSTSPGYKAYYHKLYNHYFHDKSITKALQSADFRGTKNLTVDTYMMHILNMINPAFRADALPGLKKIVEVVDLRNISRLKSTMESLHVACDIMDIILENIPEEELAQDKQNEQEEESTKQKSPSGAMPNDGDQEEEENEQEEQDSTEEEDSQQEEEEFEPLTPSQLYEAQRALEKQKKFLDGDLVKKRSTKSLTHKLNVVSKQSIDIQTVGTGSKTYTAVVADYSNPIMIGEIADIECGLENIRQNRSTMSNAWEQETALTNRREQLGYNDIMNCYMRSSYKQAVSEGTNLGALLGKKLQLHNESRERIDTRLRNGKIDNKRLAHAGYGIENIFKQISIDKYRNANLHISLDASGSMGGEKWEATLKLTAAIVKALTYTQGINVQVTIRGTHHAGGKTGESPTVVKIYDSITSKNNPTNFLRMLPAIVTSYSTPEGLSFEAMLTKNMLKPGTSEMDSYFLNISDGEPGMSDYYGISAVNHTAAQIKKMETSLGMKIISFFIASGDLASITDYFNRSTSGANFKRMYGKSASVVNPESAMDIARALNKKFMEK